jgi:hypothetical protein
VYVVCVVCVLFVCGGSLFRLQPEWYLMDTREVIRLNCDFLVHHVQPLLDKKNLTYYNAKVVFSTQQLMITTH